MGSRGVNAGLEIMAVQCLKIGFVWTNPWIAYPTAEVSLLHGFSIYEVVCVTCLSCAVVSLFTPCEKLSHRA